MIASVHLADVGNRDAFRTLRRAPRPSDYPGLRSARVALAAPLGQSPPPRPQRRVALIAFWDDDEALDRFIATDPTVAALAPGFHARLAPLRAWGTWPGLPGDVPNERAVDYEGPALVLTLGRLRATRTVPFFRTSARAERAVVNAPGVLWATGLARPPFVATCSLWESTEALTRYAYGQRDPAHPAAIDADKAKPFHHESAFIRFRAHEVEGSLSGRNPLTDTVAQQLVPTTI